MSPDSSNGTVSTPPDALTRISTRFSAVASSCWPRARELDALLVDRERLLERQLARLEPADDLAQPREDRVESGLGVRHARHHSRSKMKSHPAEIA